MAISVDEVTKIISIPKADLIFISGTTYELDTEVLRGELRVWEATTPGSWRSITHNRFPPYIISGVTYAQAINITNGYTITFEDGQYRVLLTGSNNNILDVSNVNQVSIAPQNSAGLVISRAEFGKIN